MQAQTTNKKLIFDIIGSAMTVYNELGERLAEPIYQEALYIEL